MKQSKWDVSSDIDWSKFGSGENLIFIECTDHSRKDIEGDFTATVRGLIDEQGRLHVLETEITPNKEKELIATERETCDMVAEAKINTVQDLIDSLHKFKKDTPIVIRLSSRDGYFSDWSLHRPTEFYPGGKVCLSAFQQDDKENSNAVQKT